MVSRGRKPGHDPFALERSPFGPFLGTVAGVRWSPTRLKIIKTDTHLPSWMRKFLLEGAFSAISSAYLRACLFRLVYVGGNASLRSANLSEPQRSCSPTTSLST